MEFGRISSYELMPADFRHCINVALNVDVYIFGPPVGSILKAVVNQTSDNHISCLVHNLFNVSIVRPEDQPYDQWPGSKIKKEDIINVRVLSFDLTKKLPHITGDIVNKNDRCSKPENELDNYSSQCSSTDKSAKGLQKDSTSLLKQLSRDSELSDEMHIITSPFKNKNKLKMSPIYKKTSINNREYIKNQLYSSTPISNSENSVNDITVIRNKPFEQFKNNLVKHNAEKLSIKQLKKYEKDDDSYAKHNIDVLNQERVKQDSEKEVTLNISEENVSMPSFINFSTIGTNFSPAKYNLESSSNENIILSVKDLDQKKNVNREPEINKLDLTESKICMANSDDQSSSDDDNYTKLKQSILKQDDIKSYSDDKKFKLDNSVNVHSSSLSSKNRKTFQSNDKNDCKNQIINKIVQRESTSTSDSESSSNENIILSVKDFDQKKNVNREPEINKLDLTESKICMSDSDDQSSSNDAIYTKLKLSLSKPYDENCDLDSEKLKHDNSVNVHSSSLSSKKRKTFQSNDKKECNNQIINKFVQRQSSSTSDSESSSNENIILPVKDLDQKKNVNREPEINKLDLTESKICMSDSDDQSSSDDDSYTKLKQSILKQDDIKSYSDDKKFKLDNSVNVHSSSLSSKNRKTFQSNDTNDCKNQIINKVVQRQSTSTSSDSESSSNENIILPVKDLDQKKNLYKEIKRNKLNLTGSKINMTNIEYTSSSDDEIYKKIIDDESKQNITKPLSTNQNYHIMHSNDEYDSSTSCIYNTSSRASKLNIKEDLKNIVKTEDCHINSINNSISKKKKSKQSSLIANKQTNNKDELIKLILELSTQSSSILEKETLNDSVNIHASTLNTKNTKNYQTNDRKDYKKQIENKVVKKQSTISSSLSDSESSCENIKPPVKDLNQKKNVNYEPEIDKLNLTGSKINIQNTECENNSIADISKQVNKKLYTTNQSSNKGNYLNGVNDSLSYFVHDEYTPSSKLINSNTKKSFIKMAETDTVKIDKLPIEKTSKKNKKQKSSKCTLLKSPKDNKSLIDLMKITNNKDKLIKKILEEDYNSSISSVDTDNDLEFFKKNVEKQRLNKIKNAKVLEISSKNNNSNKQKKPIKKSDDIITKSQNATDKLSDFILDAHTPASKLINSYTKEHFNVTEIDKNKIDKLSNEKTPKNNKKQGSENSTLLKSPKNNKSFSNLMKITNNKDKLVKTILDEDSSNSRTSSVSTDDDIEFIKKIVERQRLNKIKNAKLQEVSIKNNTSNKQSKTVQKLDNKITKHQIATLGITDDLSSRKRKRSGELTKDLLLDSVLNSLQDSSSCQSPTKKKRIVDNSMMKTNDLTEHINNDKSSSKVKKKKKTKLNEDVITDDLVSQNVKTYREITKDLLLDKVANSLQDSSSCHSPTKKKRNVDNSMMKTNDLTEHINNDKSSSVITSEITKDLLLDKVANSLQDSSSCHSPTKKKRNVDNSMMKTNDLTEHINYNKSSSEVKKKKKTKLNEDVITDDLVSQNMKTYREITKDLLLDKVANSLQDSSSCHFPTKKKRNVDNSMMKTNDASTHINYDKSLSKVKKKKKTKLNEDIINLNKL
ncbi:Hypothetical protein CINCED_3A002098 [Cinara cedri]|uniref:Uncharacterized protein n=1 Tax=Cinara cedri TaxID=506608 RepID=A0A5E4NLU0_9HEMI|nr:Hypothetical protein CINCED_3A002098 [Cinara cedri]